MKWKPVPPIEISLLFYEYYWLIDPVPELLHWSCTVQPHTNSHLFTTAAFLADSPYIDTCLNFSTMATLLRLQGGHCGEVQL